MLETTSFVNPPPMAHYACVGIKRGRVLGFNLKNLELVDLEGTGTIINTLKVYLPFRPTLVVLVTYKVLFPPYP